MNKASIHVTFRTPLVHTQYKLKMNIQDKRFSKMMERMIRMHAIQMQVFAFKCFSHVFHMFGKKNRCHMNDVLLTFMTNAILKFVTYYFSNMCAYIIITLMKL